MTIDEVLTRIAGSQACCIARHEDTGEIVHVAAFSAWPTDEESTTCLMSHEKFKVPVYSCFLHTETVTREFLERENDEAEIGRRRIDLLRKWSRLPCDGLIKLLENPNHYPLILNDADDFIITHLWRVHRHEITETHVDRLRILKDARSHKSTARLELDIFLAALEDDEPRLLEIWKGQQANSIIDAEIMVLEAFAHVQPPSEAIVEELISILHARISFIFKYAAMRCLGQIGSFVGERSVEEIRSTIYDSSAEVKRLRDRVIERLTTPAMQWQRCKCANGYVHHRRLMDGTCKACLGIGYVLK